MSVNTTGVRSSKLSFKRSADASEKPKKSKKHKTSSEKNDTKEGISREVNGWVSISAIEHFKGPIVALFPAITTVLSMFNPPETEHVIMRSFVSPNDDNDSIDTFEPVHVNQVFIAQKLVGSSSGSDAWSLKSTEGKFLSCDKFGVVSCCREAVGPTEEWIPTVLEDGVTLQSVFGKYLKVNQSKEHQKVYQLRCDSDDIGPCETFVFKCQAKMVVDARQQKKLDKQGGEKISIDLEALADNAKIHQTWGGGRYQLNRENTVELKKARQEGHLAEALLDRRSKMKADRYCK